MQSSKINDLSPGLSQSASQNEKSGDDYQKPIIRGYTKSMNHIPNIPDSKHVIPEGRKKKRKGDQRGMQINN